MEQGPKIILTSRDQSDTHPQIVLNIKDRGRDKERRGKRKRRKKKKEKTHPTRKEARQLQAREEQGGHRNRVNDTSGDVTTHRCDDLIGTGGEGKKEGARLNDERPAA
eukprot:TRINITY_DN3852_c0_g1_i2.p2 TRINITY_DN3852_c0_g1~~TRINITY_DN3852_c0_g1_i2.p2  ORF type:complete len:108 (-),score=10.10 TRINITY_DN3852_c0_g1_i2:1079-1402(-)